METIKRRVQICGEKGGFIYVALQGKVDGIYEAKLPKNQIKITDRIYGFGGSKTAVIEFPKSLATLFKVTF